jgi:gentisate 1,2-dioxygenase
MSAPRETSAGPRDAYADALAVRHLAPLWQSIRSLIPYDLPARGTAPALWRYADVRPLLVESGARVPIELAERRALILCNPGLGPDAWRATPSIFAAFQLLLPGEVAANHRHTASALRFVIEGRGAYTTVNRERLPMEPGDLVLTPGGCWHEHGQEHGEPVVWFDALDLPIVYYLEASISEAGVRQDAPDVPDAAAVRFRGSGLVPYGAVGSAASYPLLRFPWRAARAALADLSAGTPRDAAVHLAYVNPLTGTECLPTLGCSVLMLRPGESLTLACRSASAVLHVIEGAGDAAIDGASFAWEERDVLAVPTHARTTLANRSTRAPAFVFMVDDAPLQRKMRIYQEFA